MVPMVLASALAACASQRAEPDTLCEALLDYANAAGPVPRSVAFTTDWALRPDPSDPESLVFGTKTCKRGDNDAGRDLCAYLMEHTSTEFASINYMRVLRCMGVHVASSWRANDPLPPRFTSSRVMGVRLKASLTATLDREREMPLLEISVKSGSKLPCRLTTRCSGRVTIKCTRPTVLQVSGSAAMRRRCGAPPLNGDVRRHAHTC